MSLSLLKHYFLRLRICRRLCLVYRPRFGKYGVPVVANSLLFNPPKQSFRFNILTVRCVSVAELADCLLWRSEKLCSATKIGCRIADHRDSLLSRHNGRSRQSSDLPALLQTADYHPSKRIFYRSSMITSRSESAK